MAAPFYLYTDSRPHAVTAAHGNSYGYDGNGNQTSRTVGGTTYTLTFDYENRLTAISGGSTDASFVYDADGNRVRGTVNGETAVYIGGIYEYSPVADTLILSNQTLSGTETYEVDGTLTAGPSLTVSSGADITFRSGSTISLQPGFHAVTGSNFHAEIASVTAARVTTYYKGPNGITALRRVGHADNDGVFYLLRDHLNSSRAITNRSGTTVASHYYFPFGGNRGDAFSELTAKRFTGQYHEDALPGGEGLSYYGARWYDPQVGRFTSADTIVPEPGNPQALNRYAYVLNNPLKYQDPSGHAAATVAFDGGGSCATHGSCYTILSKHKAAKQEAEFNRFALNFAAMLPYADTGEDFLVATTGCGYSCQAGYEESAGMGWRLLAAGGIFVPAGYRTAREGLTRVENAIAAATEEGMVIYTRGRPSVPGFVEKILPAKPVGAKTLKFFRRSMNFPFGIRWTDHGLVYSDLDLAYITMDGRIVTDLTVIERVMNNINSNYGRNVVQHGDHFNGMLAGESGATMEKFLEPLHAFDNSGYLGSIYAVESVVQEFLDILR